MSAFTEPEIQYLTSQGLARLATVGPDGQPHIVPVTFTFNAAEDAIDVLPDPRRARAIEVRGRAEALTGGGSKINPRLPNFAEEFLRIRPTRILSWGLETLDGTLPSDFRVDSRAVG